MPAATPSTRVIVGAGQAGATAALALREAGFDGRIVVVGNERHRPYERPSLSKRALQSGQGPVQVWPEHWDRDHGVELYLGRTAHGLDLAAKRIVLDDGASLGFDRLLLATGGHPKRLSLPGADLPGVQFLRTLDESRLLRQAMLERPRLAVVGGGLIGLEVAATARRLGCEVTVLEAGPHLLGRVAPPEIAALVGRRHRAQGIAIHTGTRPVRFLGTERLEEVGLSDGRSVAADVAVVGIGIAPATDLAMHAGLAVQDGIVVDAHCRTSHPDVFAAGDCTRQIPHAGDRGVRLETWSNARAQGLVAGRNMAGACTAVEDTPWGWSEQGDLTLQFAGTTADWGGRIVRPTAKGLLAIRHLEGRLTAAAGADCAKEMLIAKRMIAEEACIDPALLADEARPFKSLLASGAA